MSERRKYIITAQQTGPLRIQIDLSDTRNALEGIISAQE